MRLTKQTNYAIRLMMYCAAQGADQLSRVSDVAKAYGVSELFMFKVLQPLVHGKLVTAVRGRNGGIRLARPADMITLLDVVRLTEESFSMAECFDEGVSDCPLIDACSLNGALRKALNAFFDVLDSYTIAELVRTKPDIRSLLKLVDLKAAS